MKKGAEIALEIESLAYGGQGVSHYGGLTIFVERCLPGQTVLARLYKKKKSFAEAYPLKILQRAPGEIEAVCPHFGICGGCRLQNMAYGEQLETKTRQVADLLERIGGFEDLEVPPALPSPETFHYRNKMEFTFTGQPWRVRLEDHQKHLGLGLHVPGRFDKIVNIETCALQSEAMDKVLRFTADWASTHVWEPYHLKEHTGWARNLVLRRGVHTDELMVNLVTTQHDTDLLGDYPEALREACPEVTTLVNNVTTRQAGVATGEKEFILFGSGLIRDRLQDLEFDIAANAFFQTNTLQAERLYTEAISRAGLRGDEVVYDLYCGTGTIALFMASSARQVYGFEVVPEAIENARENATRLGVVNAHFILGDLADIFHPEKPRPDIPPADVVVVDPPRAGLHKRVVREILSLAPRRVVYVSCNPSTLARDLQLLCAERYELEGVQPVDMFPHTAHIETVAGLKLRETPREGAPI